MIPIWAKDSDGKWQVLPAYMLVTFEDGKVGYNWSLDSRDMDPEKKGDRRRWQHLLIYDDDGRWLLKKQVIKE